MSKRFGRTQKRDMREKIKKLEERVYMEHSLTDWHSDKREFYKNRYEELIAEFKRWWDYCILLEPENIDVTEFPPEFRVDQRQPFTFDFGTNPSSVMDLHYQTLEALEIAAKRCPENMTMHVMLRIKDTIRKYYMSEKSLKQFQGLPKETAKIAFTEIKNSIYQQYKGRFKT